MFRQSRYTSVKPSANSAIVPKFMRKLRGRFLLHTPRKEDIRNTPRAAKKSGALENSLAACNVICGAQYSHFAHLRVEGMPGWAEGVNGAYRSSWGSHPLVVKTEVHSNTVERAHREIKDHLLGGPSRGVDRFQIWCGPA